MKKILFTLSLLIPLAWLLSNIWIWNKMAFAIGMPMWLFWGIIGIVISVLAASILYD